MDLSEIDKIYIRISNLESRIALLEIKVFDDDYRRIVKKNKPSPE